MNGYMNAPKIKDKQEETHVFIVRETALWVFYPKAIDWIYNNIRHQICPKFSTNDLACPIYQNEYDYLQMKGWLKIHPWTPDAQKLIDANLRIFERKK